jgi:hypothetical protein
VKSEPNAMAEALQKAIGAVEGEGLAGAETHVAFDLAQKMLERLADEPNGKLVLYLLDRLVLNARAEDQRGHLVGRELYDKRHRYQHFVDHLTVYAADLRLSLKKNTPFEKPEWSDHPGCMAITPKRITRVLQAVDGLLKVLYEHPQFEPSELEVADEDPEGNPDADR